MNVALFPLLFREQADEWPEQDERETCWFDLADAAEAVDEPELKALIAGFREPPAPTPLSEWAMPAVQSKLRATLPVLRWLHALMQQQRRFLQLFAAHGDRKRVGSGEWVAV